MWLPPTTETSRRNGPIDRRADDRRLPPDLIQQLMRHADFRTTQKYSLCDTIHTDADRIREIPSSVTHLYVLPTLGALPAARNPRTIRLAARVAPKR